MSETVCPVSLKFYIIEKIVINSHVNIFYFSTCVNESVASDTSSQYNSSPVRHPDLPVYLYIVFKRVLWRTRNPTMSAFNVQVFTFGSSGMKPTVKHRLFQLGVMFQVLLAEWIQFSY